MTPIQRLVLQIIGSSIVTHVLSNVAAVSNSVYQESIVDQGCLEACSFTTNRIECINCLPQNVTAAVNEVVLLGLNESRIVPHMFCGVSWPRVVNLTILNSDGNQFNIQNFTFDCLTKIKTLQLGLTQLINFSRNALCGLDDVRTLDLTNCIRLEISGLTPGLLSDAIVPRLQTIILSNVGSAYDGIQLSQAFVDLLEHRKISNLDISFSTVGFANPHVDIGGLCKCVEKLNLANSRLLYLKFAHPATCDSLRVIDVSGVTFPGAPIFIGNITIPPGVYTYGRLNDSIDAFKSVSIIYANSLIPTKHYIYLNNVTLHLRANNSMTEFHLSGYSVPLLEVKFKIDPNHMEYFDISNNKIESLSPDSLAYLDYLKIIDLSNNRLALSRQYKDTFSKLFRNNSKLEIAQISCNWLTTFPLNVFELNTEMKQIDLSNNKFTQIPFEISHLHKLDLLNLSGNSVEYLNGWSRHQTDMLHKHKQENFNTTDGKTFTLDLRDNIFSCKCHCLDFIKWFIHSPVFEDSRDSYYCEIDGKHMPMDTTAINAAESDCDKPKREARRILLIVSLPCVSTGILVVIAIFTFKRYKRNRLNRRLRQNIDLIHGDRLRYRFPVFLSYTSEDSEFVEPNILKPLEVSFYLFIGFSYLK